MALFRTQHRAADAQADLTELQTRNNVIRQMTDDLRWATQINAIDATSVTCTVPVLDQPWYSAQISYVYDPNRASLYYVGPDAVQKVLAEDVTLFQLGGQVETGGTDTYINYLTVSLQIGTDPRTLTDRNIPLPNHPLYSDGGEAGAGGGEAAPEGGEAVNDPIPRSPYTVIYERIKNKAILDAY